MTMEIHSDPNTTAPMYETLIGQMVQVVVEEIDPEQAILFGSCGRGDAVASSDVDLLVVLSTPFGTGRERVSEEARLWRALARFHVPKDVLVCSREAV